MMHSCFASPAPPGAHGGSGVGATTAPHCQPDNDYVALPLPSEYVLPGVGGIAHFDDADWLPVAERSSDENAL